MGNDNRLSEIKVTLVKIPVEKSGNNVAIYDNPRVPNLIYTVQDQMITVSMCDEL